MREEERKMREVLRYPEIFHWLGLYSFDYLEAMAEEEMKKEELYEEEEKFLLEEENV